MSIPFELCGLKLSAAQVNFFRCAKQEKTVFVHETLGLERKTLKDKTFVP
jgi:hypothetical protein